MRKRIVGIRIREPRVYAKAAVTIPSMRLIAPADYRRMPWKNGGGTTFEVAVHPPGADWGSFAWRVSIAEIADGGPFSSFPGIDRSLVVLRGGMILSGVHEKEIELRPYDCVAFDGEAQVGSRLPAGPARDFNVMTRRSAARADVRVVRAGRVRLDAATTYVCHAASGRCGCVVDDTTIDVPEAHTLVADVTHFAVDVSHDAVAVVAMVRE
jgi:environmental stress-induced protein Ves